MGGPASGRDQKAVDTALGFYTPTTRRSICRAPGRKGWRPPHGLLVRRDGPVDSLAGYSYRLMDIERSPVDVLLASPSLWLYTEDFMDHETQAKLAGYVKTADAS